jgi:hypothetical protein
MEPPRSSGGSFGPRNSSLAQRAWKVFENPRQPFNDGAYSRAGRHGNAGGQRSLSCHWRRWHPRKADPHPCLSEPAPANHDLRLNPAYQAEHKDDIAALRAALDVTEFEAAWDAGRALSLDQAAALSVGVEGAGL